MFRWGSLAPQFAPTRLEFRIHNVSQAAPKGSRQNAVVPAPNPLRSIGFPTWGCSPKTLEGFALTIICVRFHSGISSGSLRSNSLDNLLPPKSLALWTLAEKDLVSLHSQFTFTV